MFPLLHRAARYVFRKTIGKLAAAPVRRRLNAFEQATHKPRDVQEKLLREILTYQANTSFGKEHHFNTIGNIADFRRQLPVAGYDYFEPYINRMLKGEFSALVADRKVWMFALTSGTTATRKYIPVTDRYLSDYRRGWNIWGLKSFLDHRKVFLRPIVQLSGDWEEYHSEGGTPCGAVTGLTATMQKRLIRWMYCVPPCVGKVRDASSKYYLALRLSIPRSVGMIIAANPSTLINLARAGDTQKESLIRDIHDGTLSDKFDIPADIRSQLRSRFKRNPERARQLEEIVARTGTLYPKDYWTEELLLGNWTGGSVGTYLRHYPRYYGSHPVRDVGLIASEGRMTIPVNDGTAAGVLDVTTHYFEFIPEAEGDSKNPTVLAAHELKEGGRYFILLTTAFGLYRYNIHDLVRVTGFYNGTPLIEFLSKGAHFASITGEKLSEYQVTQAMSEVLHELNLTLTAYSLAPVWPRGDELPYYGLFLESGDLASSEAANLAARLEARLAAINIEYESKRSSGRLGAIRIEPVPSGFWLQWDRERLRGTGGVLEQYKHPCLINDPQFSEKARKATAIGA
jgi:GH3 auxin-responsive promoter